MSAAEAAITPELQRRVTALWCREVAELRPMPGGHSGITLVASDAAGERVVVKVAAAGRPAVGRHDVLRHTRAMSLVRPYVPVPEVLATDETEPPLALISFAAGQAVEPVIDETGTDLPEDLVLARFDAATEILAALHRIPLDDLEDEPVRSPDAELTQFGRIAAAGEEEFRTLGAEALAALGRHIPAPDRVSLVHGDFRLGNLLMEGTEPRALVDWEIWTVGDPRVDLGWMATFAETSNFPGIAREDVRAPGVDHVVSRYEKESGTSLLDAEWFLRLGAFRMGAIMSHNLHRHRTGRHVDPYQETLPATIERLLQVAAGRS